MKIVFWGTPKYAAENLINLVKSGQDIIAVVTQPDRKRSRGNKLSPSPVKEAANDLGIPVLTTQSISKDQNTKETLKKFVSHKQSSNERRYKLEQFRALENDIKINVALAKTSPIGVDTEEDFLAIKKIMEYKLK